MSARILVVDDVAVNVKLLTAKLSAEYYEVVAAYDGPSALALLAETPTDLVLLDVMMPGMTGFEVCRRIKANPQLSHIPVVMVTALDSPEDRVEGLDAGADEFLTKPVEDLALFARVRSLVRLKRTIDEWRMREETRARLGAAVSDGSMASEPGEAARILLTSGDPRQVERVCRTLAADRHTVVTLAPEAFAVRAAAEPWELAIVDLELGGADALRLCSRIRADGATRHLPLLLIGAKSDSARLIKGLDLGVHDYVNVPIDPNELRARVCTQVRRQRFQERIRRSHEESLAMAVRDGLTGLFNRSYAFEHLARQLAVAQAAGRPLGLLIADVDKFKAINDTHGHAAGDDVLRGIGDRLKDNLRGIDTLARIGGEEFVVILPDSDLDTASAVAERLRLRIAGEPFASDAAGRRLEVTASFGVACARPSDTVDELVARADSALYAAKRAGRDRVMCSDAAPALVEKQA